MEVKKVSSAGRSNRMTKDRCNKVRSTMPKRRARHGINESMFGISKVMSHLIPKGRQFEDDVNLLEFTVEYLKQTTDFQRGVGFCAEETKHFLKHHIFDRRKISDLFETIEQRIDFISKQQLLQNNSRYTVQQQQQNTFDSNHSLVDETTGGVLLDLSLKQNRRHDERARYNYIHNSATIPSSLCNNLKKREILDKIRKKILDKRRISGTMEIVQNEMMWRPWRY